MNFDNAQNAQIEILRDIFGYEEYPGKGAGAEAYVQPGFDMVASQMAIPQAAVEAQVAPSVMTMAVAKKVAKQTDTDSDHIAIGVAPKDGLDEVKLVALYQRPGHQKTDLMQRLKSRYGDEIEIRYGGRVRSLQDWHRRRNDPMRLGSSCGHPDITAGTLGCFAADRVSGDVGILSNNHVLANVNAGEIGDDILQPGPTDGGGAADKVAELTRFVPIVFSGVSNELDCAWARLEAGRGTDRTSIFDSSDTQVGQLTQVQPVRFGLLDRVKKIGRTTGYREGEIRLINVVNLNVNMRTPWDPLMARFDNVFSIESITNTPFSEGGDSGSLIMNDAGQPGGLLFAGSENGGAFNQGTTYACHLDLALNALNIDLVT